MRFPTLVSLLLLLGSTAAATPRKLANAGDSISEGVFADNVPFLRPGYSFVSGTDPDVRSVFWRYLAQNPALTQEPESVINAQMVGGDDNFAAQASRICAQRVLADHVTVLLGGNDVCVRPPSDHEDAAANLYAVSTWVNALRAGLDQLAACLPKDATVQVLSAPRIDYLYEAGHAKGGWCHNVIWPLMRVCTKVTAEDDPARRRRMGQRINAYNEALAQEVALYDANLNGRNPRGLRFFTDWKGSMEDGHASTSLGAHRFSAEDLSWVDCFHPHLNGQRRIACAAWAANPDGSGTPYGCLR